MSELKRELGFFGLMLTGVGIILGAGIYALIGKVAGIAGNGMWLSFVIASLVAMFTGLSYAELSSKFPKAGAEYVYTKNAFNKRLAFVIGFIIIIASMFSSAAVAIGFGGYLKMLTGIPVIAGAIMLIAGLSFIIFYGIKQSVRFAIAGTLIEAAGLFIIIIIGLPYFGSVNYFEFAPVSNIMNAAALIFFAYIGFEEMVRLSEETKNARKIMPIALIASICITTVIYILVSVSAVSVLDANTLAASSAPLADVASVVFGPNAGHILAIIALFATANTVLLMLLSTSRIIYGIGKTYSPKNIFARIHKKTRTPWIAVAITGFAAIMLILPGEIEGVAKMTDLLLFVTFITINAAVIRLRYTNKTSNGFKIPLNIGKFPILPVLGIISCAALAFSIEIDIAILAICSIIIGFIIFELMKKRGIEPEF